MADVLEDAVALVMLLMHQAIGTANPTEKYIKDAIDKACLLMPLDEGQIRLVEKQIQSRMSYRMDLGTCVYDPETYKPWVASRKTTIDSFYWKRYREYLLRQKGWNQQVVDRLGDVSDEILDMCGNPAEKRAWKRRGLILGDVQSGKTSNYLSLCNKAADAGYRVIILLTGTIEALRKQTQDRVDAGFVGLNSRNLLQRQPEKKYIGVGIENSCRVACPFTSIMHDFSSSTLQRLNFTLKSFHEPVVLVVKKNKGVLTSMETWLRTCNTDVRDEKIELPLLLIDDEADNASINTRNADEDPTAINTGIRAILQLFKYSSYVAVTATPFANIFINPDRDEDIYNGENIDLFPSDFIYALHAPNNYIGNTQIFGANAPYSTSLVPIHDCSRGEEGTVFRSRAKSSHNVESLPISLREAIAAFMLINTIRDLRGICTDHRSMLINVSQYINVQDQVYDLVLDFIRDFKQAITNYGMLPEDMALSDSRMKFLHDIWQIQFPKEGPSWITIQHRLYKSVVPLEVRLVNQRAKSRGIERLDYEPYKEKGLRVIAVGGNSLSRGLTLEGLCVSYFCRNSQMYDTLLQMGRWFGYRDGYDDLCRVWMMEDAISWYQHITDAVNELREEIMEMNRIGLTPKDFGLKVRQDITSLFVTAKNKMRYTMPIEKWISLSAKLIETPRLIANRDRLIQNVRNTDLFISTLLDGNYRHDNPEDPKRIMFIDVPAATIADYIAHFITHPMHLPFSARDLGQYIRTSNMDKWDVVLYGVGNNRLLPEKYCGFFRSDVLNLGLFFSERVLIVRDNVLMISGERNRVGVPGATKYGIDEDAQKVEEAAFWADENNKGKTTVPDRTYLRSPGRKPILLIYLIHDSKDKGTKADHKYEEAAQVLVGDIPVVGLGLGFPGTGKGEGSIVARYILNMVEIMHMSNIPDEEGDEFED